MTEMNPPGNAPDTGTDAAGGVSEVPAASTASGPTTDLAAEAQAAVAPPRRGGRGRVIVIVVGLVVILGVILYATRNNQSPNDLAVGSCFDVPNDTSISTVERHDCTESHDAEVFAVTTYTGTETEYPSSGTFDTFAQTTCEPAFQAYVGQAFEDSDLDAGYLYPSSDSWSGGDRTVTCYATPSDGSKLTQSVKGSAAATP